MKIYANLINCAQVDLDPMSLASVIMAIGFSVDYTAHTSYHYQKAIFDRERGSQTRHGRLHFTFESVAFPMGLASRPGGLADNVPRPD